MNEIAYLCLIIKRVECDTCGFLIVRSVRLDHRSCSNSHMLNILLDGCTVMRVDVMRAESSELHLIFDFGFACVVQTRSIEGMLRGKLV